ncbi:putative methyltransferase-domain-containing protein [Thamnocephalis sphaerospora]|uniref:Putative methyltransferase-domain-containing protein n=1 Tax=Thamnocephalis sphaerospora TaxID=78915 RepID=A0A4P9XWK5_9FUNG|nr:putative methyltransferase-domain-containing protein [Thamnocephalis sphaerospora]|eukprot:RKP10001.1 putative methyltransferase-domain-containing protein [Thamnocephalis sphaerospora]
MTTVKTFHFGQKTTARPSSAPADVVYGADGQVIAAQVSVTERIDPAFHCYVWPSALVLAKYVWAKRAYFGSTAAVIELGAGTGLPGLLAAKLGAQVYLTDKALALPALQQTIVDNALCRQADASATRRGTAQPWPLGWGKFTSDGLLGLLAAAPPITWILGADVFYEPASFEAVLATVAYILRVHPQACFVTAYQERSATRSIQPLLERWGLAGRRVPSVTLDRDAGLDNHDDYDSSSMHSVDLYEIAAAKHPGP